MAFLSTPKRTIAVTFAHDLSGASIPVDKIAKDQTFWYGGIRYKLSAGKAGRTWARKV